MSTSRLEAFTDGVLAIIITVMVLELNVPGEPYTLSNLIDTSGVGLHASLWIFVYIGIYWNNHHHMFQIVDYVDGSVLWANLHLLFWLSLYPFTTAWLDESNVAVPPRVVYGCTPLAAARAYYVLQQRMMRVPDGGDRLREVVGDDLK